MYNTAFALFTDGKPGEWQEGTPVLREKTVMRTAHCLMARHGAVLRGKFTRQAVPPAF